MLLRIVSDLHLDIEYKELSILPDEDKQVLILAGDIASNIDLFDEFLLDVVYRFKQIIIIYGNHEYYGHNVEARKNELFELCTDYSNVQLLDDVAINYDGVTIYGGTLWTSAYKDPVYWLNDFNVVDFPDDFYIEEHNCQVNHLSKMIDQFDVVITHHAPSYKSCAPRFENSPMNKYFMNHLDNLILDAGKKLKLWVHGHGHDSCQYKIGECDVICNPKGYNDENKEYNDGLIYEI